MVMVVNNDTAPPHPLGSSAEREQTSQQAHKGMAMQTRAAATEKARGFCEGLRAFIFQTLAANLRMTPGRYASTARVARVCAPIYAREREKWSAWWSKIIRYREKPSQPSQ